MKEDDAMKIAVIVALTLIAVFFAAQFVLYAVSL